MADTILDQLKEGIVISSAPSPVGAATSAKQDTGNASLDSIDSDIDVSLSTRASETTLASLNSKVTVVNTGAVVVNSSVLPSGAATSTLQIAGNASLSAIDSDIDVALSTRASESTLSALNGKIVTVNTGAVIISSSALPTGASTETTLNSLNGKVTAVNTGAVVVASSALPTGAATESTLSTINGKLSSLGQKTMTSSVPVVISSDQSAIPVTQSGIWGVTNISGTVSLPTGASTSALQTSGNASLTSIDSHIDVALSTRASESTLSTLNGKVTVVNTGAVVVSSSALPSGAATSALQTAGNASLSSIDSDIDTALSTRASEATLSTLNGKVTAVNTGAVVIASSALPSGAATEATSVALSAKFGSVGQKTMAGSAPVVLASDQVSIPVTQSGTWSITNISGTVSLPTGAATETTVAAINAKLGSLGQKAMTGSAPVVIASDQSAISITTARTSLTAASPTAATVGIASAQAVASNVSRKGLTLINTSINTISFGIGVAAVLNSGHTLYPGGNWVLDQYTFTTGAINAIASAASSNLSIQEFT